MAQKISQYHLASENELSWVPNEKNRCPKTQFELYCGA